MGDIEWKGWLAFYRVARCTSQSGGKYSRLGVTEHPPRARRGRYAP